MSREYTKTEVQAKFLEAVRNNSVYWQKVPEKTLAERLDGLAFSILALLDGCQSDIPGFAVVPSPHESDKDFRAHQGKNWYPELPDMPDGTELCDIAGNLHERYYA